MYKTLLTSLDKGVFTVTINRADKMNAINKDVMADLDALTDEINSDPEIRGVILTGAGQKAFVAGADISEFTGLSKSQGMDLAKKGQKVFFKIENCSKPIIAVVNGFALGGGCELAMACHFRIASTTAKFGQPEVNLGLIPGYGGTQRLVQLVGKGRAIELLMTGNMIDANTALQYGLVNHVVAPEELMNKANEIATLVNSKAPLAVSACIKTANAVYDEAIDGFTLEIDSFGELFDTADAKEGT